MTGMLDPRLPEIIGLTILHSLWQITLLWIVLVAVLRLWPKTSPAVRYTLAIATLTLSVISTGTTTVYEWQAYTRQETSVLTAGLSQPLNPLTPRSLPSGWMAVKQNVVSAILHLNTAAPILAWLWFAGLAIMATRFGGSFFYLARLRAPHNLTATTPAWPQELGRLSTAVGLTCRVTLATSAHISSPVTLGTISPIILLPAGVLSGLSTAQIEAILVHELYHIKRRDYAINIAQALVEVMLFYHPAIWHINHIIREERENCCDDQTLAFCGDAITYARALTQIQETNILTKPILAMSATGTTTGNFTNRIKRLFNIYPNPAQARSKGLFAIGALTIYLAIVLTTANISTAQQAPAAKPKNGALANPTAGRYNTFSGVFGDSIPTREQVILLDGKKITEQKLFAATSDNAAPGVRSIHIQLADTTVDQQHVKLIIKMVSKYIIPGNELKFAKISPEDSVLILNSMHHLAQAQPIRVQIDTTR
jgi:bla regulator protein BlaR1